ncbi:hypothetical protein D5086_018079 [Populus alba]|uniref:Uncharacterized protein n=1 Tax=Populus alba TaxID=43335 RepID=A0ACC4BNT6_POPAL
MKMEISSKGVGADPTMGSSLCSWFLISLALTGEEMTAGFFAKLKLHKRSCFSYSLEQWELTGCKLKS